MKKFAFAGISILFAGCTTASAPKILPEVSKPTLVSSSYSSEESPCSFTHYKRLDVFRDKHGKWLKIIDGQLFSSADAQQWSIVDDGIFEIPLYNSLDKVYNSTRMRIAKDGLFTVSRSGEAKIASTWWIPSEGIRIGISPSGTLWETDGASRNTPFPDDNGTLNGLNVIGEISAGCIH